MHGPFFWWYLIFFVADLSNKRQKILYYLKKFDYIFLTITIYLLSICLFYIPMGIYQSEMIFKTFNESSPCTSDETLTCSANLFWKFIGYGFLGPVGYMFFAFLFHKVSFKWKYLTFIYKIDIFGKSYFYYLLTLINIPIYLI